MKHLKFIRKNDQSVVAQHAIVADRFWLRLKGLIGTRDFQAGEGMFFPHCNDIHMWMMQIPIDVVFLKKQKSEWEILSLHENLKPWKILPVMCVTADDTLELPVGTVSRMNLKKGEVLCIAS